MGLIVRNPPNPRQLFDSASGTIYRIATATGAISTLPPVDCAAPTLWADGGNLFFSCGTAIEKMDVTSGNVSTVAGAVGQAGFQDGVASDARFGRIAGLWGNGTTLYAVDFDNHAIRAVDIRTGQVSTLTTLQTTQVAFRLWGDDSNLYIPAGAAVMRLNIQTATLTVVAGVLGQFGSEYGVGSAARFSDPYGIWGDGSNLYVTDSLLNSIRRLSPAATSESTSVTVAANGMNSLSTSNTVTSLSSGFAVYQSSNGNSAPSGLAILDSRQNGVLVSEATIPASSLVYTGRIDAENGGGVTTGIALANPNSTACSVFFYFTDHDGHDFGQGSVILPAQAQLARFLDERPFSSGPLNEETFTFVSTAPIAVSALRGFTNERSEFLTTMLPVTDPSSQSQSAGSVFPHFADGGGWTTRLVLVNPTDGVLTGTVEFRGDSGAPVPLADILGTGIAYTMGYSIPPRGAREFVTINAAPNVQVGAVWVTPSNGSVAPSGWALFSFKPVNVTVTQIGVPDVPPSTAFRLYAEAMPEVETGFAIANLSTVPVSVNFELFTASGASTGLSGSTTVSAHGHTSVFLRQIPGFESLPIPFTGVLRASTTALSGISIVGIRGRYNERGEFIGTALLPIPEQSTIGQSPTMLVFPHFAAGGGYSTEFLFINPSSGASTIDTVSIFSPAGAEANFGFMLRNLASAPSGVRRTPDELPLARR